MTTSPLKVEDSRADFEKWMNLNFDTRLVKSGIGYKGQVVNSLWMAWQASRAAIVVELPEYNGDIDDELSCFDGEYEWGNRAGADYAVTQCAGIIRAAGITVKGD